MLMEAAPRRWWVYVLRGIAAIVFGIAAWAWPNLTIGTLVIVFGIYAIADGLLSIWAALFTNAGGHRLSLILAGVAGILIGIISIAWPELTATTVVLLIAIWAVSVGLLQIFSAWQLRNEIENEWLLMLAGAGGVIWGILVMIFPGGGAVSIVWAIGLFAILLGALLIVLGFRLRNWGGPGTPVPA